MIFILTVENKLKLNTLNRLIESNLGRKTVNLADHIWKLVLSYLFRDAITLSWAFKYYQAKEHGDKVAEIE